MALATNVTNVSDLGRLSGPNVGEVPLFGLKKVEGRAGGSPGLLAWHIILRSPGGSATPTHRRENRPLLERLSRITSAASSYEIVNSGTFCLKANAKASLGRT